MKIAVALILIATPLAAQSVVPMPMGDPQIRQLADSIAAGGNAFERTQRIVHWVNDNFQWSYTDYVKRTPQEIIAQRKGNCAELASVLRAFLDASNVRSRWIREINVQPDSTPGRQKGAAAMVQRGKQYSVFGLQHNDHVWLEVWDDSTKAWFPADPAYGVVGMREWMPARLAMEHRPKPRVAAVVPIAADMVVPFVVIAGDKRNGPYDVDRTSYYLVDGFNALYGGKLTSLPSWGAWVSAIRLLSPRARLAFDGRVNLHESTVEIGKLKATYDALSREVAERGLQWSR